MAGACEINRVSKSVEGAMRSFNLTPYFCIETAAFDSVPKLGVYWTQEMS